MKDPEKKFQQMTACASAGAMLMGTLGVAAPASAGPILDGTYKIPPLRKVL